MARSYRINFILPNEINTPVGGYKVVYEYANGLVARGHTVRVVLPRRQVPLPGIVGAVKSAIWPRLHRLRNPGGITWFPLDRRVEIVYCSDLGENRLPDADFVFATAWTTAPFVANYSGRQGKKLYLIQHLETFGGPYDEVVATWRLPLHKIVIAKWLAEFADSLNETYTYIQIGVNFDQFGLDTPIESRPKRVATMYHNDYVKGGRDGINAIEYAKERVPELSAIMFGLPPKPPGLPPWMEYIREASAAQLRSIYNEASVFVHQSWAEGWPAPPAEAMACGAAIAAAANPGIMDYLKPDVTGLTVRPKYWMDLGESTVTLLTDEALRTRIAKAGYDDIHQYTWSRSIGNLANLLDQLAGEERS